MIAVALFAAVFGYGTTTFDPDTDGAPPVRFRHDGTATVIFTDRAAIISECGGDPRTISCATIGGPDIWIGNPCLFPEESYARRLCHELSHVNGWPEDHPR